MKSVKMFGKSVPILAILIISVLAVGAYAGLVSYLSTPVLMVADVESPIELRLYEPDGTLITSAFELKGGESVDFSKIAYNFGENGVPFAIALVIKGDDVGDAVIVDSAGPIGTEKQNIGSFLWEQSYPDIWNRNDLWCQIDGEVWYLHGAHDSAKEADYINHLIYSTSYTSGSPPTVNVNDKYVDALSLDDYDNDDYYVVIFGGTIGGSGVGVRNENSIVTSWGWGSVSQTAGITYHQRTVDEPCVVDGESFDVGKVRVILDSAYVGTVDIGMQVVVPGTSIGEVISTMFNP